MRRLWSVVGILLLAVSGLAAQNRRPLPPRPWPNVLDRLERMSPEERRRVLDQLPPGRRAHIEQRLLEYEKLSPAERQRLRRQFRRFRQLPPERQETARRLFLRWRELPPQQRRALGREVARLRLLSDEDRAAVLNGADYRSRFTPDEREMVETLLEIAQEPPPPPRAQ